MLACFSFFIAFEFFAFFFGSLFCTDERSLPTTTPVAGESLSIPIVATSINVNKKIQMSSSSSSSGNGNGAKPNHMLASSSYQHSILWKGESAATAKFQPLRKT